MPPRTRAVRAPKASKENIDHLAKTNVKNAGKGTKSIRKPLADKTNSASDENASLESVSKAIKKSVKPTEKVSPRINHEDRPRRNRRLPPRYVENQVLKNLSNSKDNAVTPIKSHNKTPDQEVATVESPFKTPNNVLDDSVIANRPKRVSRLPSKFDENSTPNKFVPTQCHTSTPLVPKVQDKPKDGKRTLGRLVKQAIKKPSENITSGIKITSKVTTQKNASKKVTAQQGKSNKVVPTVDALCRDECHTSTPLVLEVHDKPQGVKRTVTGKQKVATQKTSESVPIATRVSPRKTPLKSTPVKILPLTSKVTQKKLVQKKISEVLINVETNTNRRDRVRRLRKPVEYKEDTLSPKTKSPENKSNQRNRKILKTDSSFRVFEEKKSNPGDNQDIYEFTFDPSEEPPPQKKKRKKVTAKKSSKPKARVYNNNYEKNIAKALADLKNVVSQQKPDHETTSTDPKLLPSINKPASAVESATKNGAMSVPNPSSVVISTVAEIHPAPAQNTSTRSNVSKNHVSIQVEDIAADFDASIDHHDDINYSPVVSPRRIQTETDHLVRTSPKRIRTDDPLNLRTDLSFFDDQPVANSSMNASRNPMATPWRVEFENLPIKWQSDTYVKPNMTPALECSYVNNFNDSKKKHVYTNLVVQSDDPLPEIEENDAPKLKQTSIISFIKEVAERSASKKKRGLSVTPTKANSLFDANTPAKSVVTLRKESGISDKSAESDGNSGNKSLKRKNNADCNPAPAKVPRKDNDNTLFGFDDSENQENISPVKVNHHRLRSLRSRSGAVLRELNKQTGPMRADFPAAMKAKLAPSSDAVEKIYDQMKSASDAPLLLDKQADNPVTVAETSVCLEGVDSQSVHLFEDIELVHHIKPNRKSYGKAKKVTFQNSSSSASEDEVPPPAYNQSSDEADDLADLSFHVPEAKAKAKKATKKKKTKKQLLSKKEKAEADAWAASFNSMCEDVEGFDLVVE